MTFEEFQNAGESLGERAGVLNGVHGYFRVHLSRLYNTVNRFGLFAGHLGDVLEIGPFYSYTPFMLRARCCSYTVLEGDDPASYPLTPLYKEHDIRLEYIDFFDLFGPTKEATHVMAFPDGQFDTVLCCETMEHFNFNPVKFVRELHRLLKPGGKAYLTVPNKCSLGNLSQLSLGRDELSVLDSYFTYENYQSGDKKAFFGFHWREYAAREFSQLFQRVGFHVEQAGTFNNFSTQTEMGLVRRLNRKLYITASSLVPRFRSHVYLIVRK